ncbi:MAG: 2Fe-2S iron-sulfur cluster-binding protein, partial [Verrucomicrobiales bacterium]|nr:2Fe-2S iron-sulfur cluster-binding protein [Verrucomicrobiales bacterium]
MSEILIATALFTAILFVLVGFILAAKAKLVASGDVTITVNGEKKITTNPGGKLLGCLSDAGILVPSACGGGGTCGVCTVKVHSGGGDILPTERSIISKKEAREGKRLSCQVAIKQDMDVEVDPEVFETKKWLCTVRSNRNVSLLIKELVLELPDGDVVDFKAGGYIQVEVPPHELAFTDFDVEEKYCPIWDERDLWE